MKQILLGKLLPVVAAAALVTALVAVPVLASPASATRSLPSSVESGDEFDVAIQPEGCGFAGQVIETLPAGFTYLSCLTPDVGVEVTGNTVKFTFLGSDSFTYRVEAPAVTVTTIYPFHGVVKDEDKNEYPIPDDDITVSSSGTGTYTITVAVQGNGSTTPSAGSYTCDSGDVVSISATADQGWEFDRWSGDVAHSGSSSTTVTVDGSKTVTAHFSPISATTYLLAVECEPGDGGNIVLYPARGDNRYEAGTSVELTAAAAGGYAFSCWSGDLSGSANPVSIVMDCANSVTAKFVLLTQEGQADFAVSSLNISPGQVQPGQQVDISMVVTNSGEETGSYQATLYLNGDLEDTRTVEVALNSSQEVVFSITRTTPGTYTVLAGGQQGEFTVVGGQAAGDGLSAVTIIAIAAIVALVIALAFVFRRIRGRM